MTNSALSTSSTLNRAGCRRELSGFKPGSRRHSSHSSHSRASRIFSSGAFPSGQKGVVLVIALFVLVAMTLSALALIRSVDTTNLVAGNLSFRESALLSAERGAENAMTLWLAPNSGTGHNELWNDNTAQGYFAKREDPAPDPATDNGKWDAFWDRALKDKAVTAGPADVAGNTVSYVIHRLCDAAGAPLSVTAKCARVPLSGSGNSYGGKGTSINNQVYYRITARVTGPRNTVVYTQTIVAI